MAAEQAARQPHEPVAHSAVRYSLHPSATASPRSQAAGEFDLCVIDVPVGQQHPKTKQRRGEE